MEKPKKKSKQKPNTKRIIKPKSKPRLNPKNIKLPTGEVVTLQVAINYWRAKYVSMESDMQMTRRHNENVDDLMIKNQQLTRKVENQKKELEEYAGFGWKKKYFDAEDARLLLKRDHDLLVNRVKNINIVGECISTLKKNGYKIFKIKEELKEV